ncbi:MAG: hypothetical protein ACRDY2_09880 [Acidimicrobiales bacterium]
MRRGEGKGQTNVIFRTGHRVNPGTGVRYPFIVRASSVVDQFYFYGVDDDFGPFSTRHP